MARTYRWRSEDGIGLEHLNLVLRDDLIVADGVVIGECSEGPFGCSYRVCCDTAWQVRSVEVNAAGGESLVLTSDGAGNWLDGDGAAQPQLRGCIDVDIAATPFTNVLPIRRLGAALRQRTAITVVYIPVPSLKAQPAEQAYTRLLDDRCLYEGPVGAFQAMLELDPDGMVLRYPSLFTRLDAA